MKKLYLSKTDSKLFGVCGGIGETYDIDPTVVRLVTVGLAIVTAFIPVTIMYIIALAIIPERK